MDERRNLGNSWSDSMAGSPLEVGNPIGDAISRVRFAPRSNNLLSSSWDSFLRLYDVDGSALRVQAFAEGALLDCCFEDESLALSAGSDGCIRRYDLNSGAQSVMGKHGHTATCVEYSDGTDQVISAGLDKKLRFWDPKEKCENGGCKSVDSEVWSMSLCGVYVLAAVGVMVDAYDLRNLKGPVQSKDCSMDYQIQCVRSFSDLQGFGVGSIDGRVALKFLDQSKSGAMGCAFRCHPKLRDRKYHLVSVNDIAFHPCLDTFVTGDNEGYAIIWDAQSRKKLYEFQRYSNSVACLSYNHNGQLLAVASSHTYQEAKETEGASQIFIHKTSNLTMSKSPQQVEESDQF
ncbi:cell cycle arrest protein BUB3 protein [Dioscorea alata]|uniref:Cell cycle arrest protein BUB3 protein n=2 Tax=Dioscorea alata TaxID=55571 RepID=A0ACB7UJX7_DIOAL|nr:cell cycle arrest protein BUB3 protein [Dioscorea alata]